MVSRNSKQIEAVSLVDRLVVLIREAIVAGDLEPDEHIAVKKIADVHGVSMIPVREALARLLATRLVRVEPNRGYFVASQPTAEDFRQYVQARALFETSAVGAGSANATEAEIRKLRRLNERMRKLAESGKGDILLDWGKLNLEFHKILVGLARNKFIDDQYDDLSFGFVHSQLVRCHPDVLPDFSQLVEEHNAIIAALEQADGEALIRSLSDHILNLTPAA